MSPNLEGKDHCLQFQIMSWIPNLMRRQLPECVSDESTYLLEDHPQIYDQRITEYQKIFNTLSKVNIRSSHNFVLNFSNVAYCSDELGEH